LRLYVPEQQRQFELFSAQDRLEWLEAIDQLYWAAAFRRETKPQALF
jgi:hypothetical protein